MCQSLQLLKERKEFHATTASTFYLLFSRLMPKVYTVNELDGKLKIVSLLPGDADNSDVLDHLQRLVEYHKVQEFRLQDEIDELELKTSLDAEHADYITALQDCALHAANHLLNSNPSY